MPGRRQISELGERILLKFAEMLRKKSNLVRLGIAMHHYQYKNNAIRVLK